MAKSTSRTTTRKPIKIEKKGSAAKAEKPSTPKKKPSTRKKKVVAEEDSKPLPNMAKYGNEPVVDPGTDIPPVIISESTTSTTTEFVDVTDPIITDPEVDTDIDVEEEPTVQKGISPWIGVIVVVVIIALLFIIF